MIKNLFHKENNDNKIIRFGAPKWFSQLFVRIFAVLICVSVLSFSLLISPNEASSQLRTQTSFGDVSTTNIFPSSVTSEDWEGVKDALVQDLPEDALYQDFDTYNGAYIQLYEPSADVQPISTPAEILSPNDGAEAQTETIPDETESQNEIVPIESVESKTSPVSFSIPFKVDNTLYPLAQLSIVSTTDSHLLDEAGAHVEPILDDSVVPEIQVENQEESLVEEVTASSSDADTTEFGEDSAPVSDVDQPSPESRGDYYELVFEDFATPNLSTGQFVTDVRLMMSFAAKLKTPVTDGNAPYLEILFSNDSETYSVGVVLIDDETSNALNGGYYMFDIPEDLQVDDFADMTASVRFYGDNLLHEGIYVDALWMEMETLTFDAEDLNKRALEDQLSYLEAPQYSELVSEQLNFARTEAPLFNLRYIPQRNFLERGFFRLIGRDAVTVDQVLFVHQAIGEIPIESDVTLTKDGLVTIDVDETELSKFQPGTYEVVVVYNENGLETVDRFDFQWGVLSLNPEKSEYAVGEEVSLSLGALSQNGNTLCDATLNLYVTDPAGFISQVSVTPSGLCNGNNVIDVPDYTATFPTTVSGEYQLYLERIDENGVVVSYTTDTVLAVDQQELSIRRVGPTRIYPKAPYTMSVTVENASRFNGKLIERVPANFVITNTDAEITIDGEWQILTWDLTIMGGSNKTVEYTFDAPDISPYVYFLGAASLVSDDIPAAFVESQSDTSVSTTTETSVGTTTETGVPLVLPDAVPIDDTATATNVATSSVPEEVSPESVNAIAESAEMNVVFTEHRQWQIASDAVGSMLLMWDGATIPTGWTCVSCAGGDVFYQRFIMGSSTAGINGGAATHTHTAVGVVNATAATVNTNAGGANNYASVAHTHTYTPTIGTANNLPAYRNLVIIQNNSAGEPTVIPTGAIVMFDATVPTGWTRYAAQDGSYVRGESTANRTVTGGANTHTHTITGTILASAGTANANTAGASAIANQSHTHTVSSNTAAENSQPPYIEVILGKLNATSTMPNDSIGMWTEDAPTDWNVVSGSSGAFFTRFPKPAATYGTTGGATTHTPANVNGITSSGPSATTNRGGAGNARPTGAHTHSVNVTTFTSGSILPQYRTAVFAKRAGGQPPAAPTLHELFNYEKTGTSTPEFEFTANDPAGTDTLEYQFQWDTDSDLETARIGDRSSSVETGCSPNCFINTVNGGDTHPFNEAERIRFTIQSPLTNNTTYWWRVRAKKTTGSTWGSWSEIYSFTYTADTDPSQWLQTQDAQFDNGDFDNTETFGSDSVRIVQAVPTEALVAYGEGAVTTPRYRIWTGSAWGSELSAQDVGGTVQWIRTVAGTTRDEYVLGTQDASNDVNVQVFDGVGNTWGDLTEVTTAVSDNTARGFDVAYETASGDAIVVYCDGDSDPSYRVWDGATWSIASSITTSSANNCEFVSLASDPTSDEMIVVIRDTGALYEAQVWSGSAFGNSTTGGSMTDTAHEGIAVQYEESGDQAMVILSNGNGNNFLWTAWNGTEWSTGVTQALGDDFEWGVLKRDDGTDNMVLCYIDQDVALGIIRWDGESWSAFQEFEPNGGAFDFDGRPVSCEYETTSGRDGYIIFPYSDTTNARVRHWDGSVISSESNVSTITESWEIGTVRTGDGLVLAYFHDPVNTQYDFSYWNGTSWSAVSTLEGTVSVGADPRRQPIHMTAQIYQPSEGSYTSPQIDFSLVPNRPTWGEVIWNVTEPSGTDVTIQVLYATTTSVCNIPIPNGTLPGNAAGFNVSSSPLDLSSLSTTTYDTLCLKATLSSSNENAPTLDDWNISWERQPFLVQSQYRWYVNRNNQTPNDAWPFVGTDLVQNQSIPQEYSPGSGSVLRLRMAVRSDNAALSANDQSFKLQYSEISTTCDLATDWYDVGDVSSTTALWRGYNNLLALDGGTISSLLLGTDVAATYEEENDSDDNPNTIGVTQEGEWDWVIQHNSAVDNTQYCFRMVTAAGEELSDYEEYPSLLTNASPQAPSLEKLFDNAQVASTSPWFEFVSEDLESNDVTYQIQIDNNYDFASVALDRNSTTNSAEFENIVTISDKDPFTVGQTVRFKPTSALTNNTTYYWRVRAKDGSGSNAWGDWSTIESFTINTGTTITTWFQTEQEQFDTNTLEDTETSGSDDVILTTGFGLGTTTSTIIDFDDRSTGNAWGELSWTDNETLGTIDYYVEYFTGLDWALVPESFLAGNSAGFNTSPVSLLGLDPEVHNEIRIKAKLDETTGTPRLQSWTVAWGLAVEQPTLTDPFDNEKVGTTTPALQFYSSDPDVDDLDYEVSWSTDYTFTSGTTTQQSWVDAGFTNTESGGDTEPFNSGELIQYKLQPGEALTNNTTYWWRVRAKDPFDGDTWSVWSTPISFTVDTGVTVSTWFQTTDEQFATDDLFDVESSGADGVQIASTIREAFVAYAEGAVQVPRYPIWNGTSWGGEQVGVSVGGTIRFVEAAASEARNEYIIVTQEATGRVRAQVYDGDTETVGDLDTIVAAVPGLTTRGFDIAYETSSGDAIVVACNGTEATYKVWNGSSWSGSTAITLAVTANCNWISLASDPASDEIILVARDAITGATDYEALVWSGSAWGNSQTLGSAAEAADEGIAVEYEESGDRAVVVVSNGATAGFAWNSWNGTAWTGNATQALQDDFEVGRMNRDIGSDNLALCTVDNDGQVALVRWNGTTNSWNAYQTLDTAVDTKIGRRVDCIFEDSSGRNGYIMVPYSDVTNARYNFWNGSALGVEASISTIQDLFEVRATRTGDNNILTVFYDDVNTQYDFSYWDGSTWSTAETLEATAITTGAPATIPIDIVARKYPTFTSGLVTSSPIDFDDGSGLKWQQLSFSDTTPGSSQITYQLEYLNGDTWTVIPNSALSGNETGFTSSPIDISTLSRVTHNTIRINADMQCVGGNCPTLNDWTVTWAEGINVTGTTQLYNQTSSTTAGTVAVAVNGVLQSGKTSTISNGSWSIPNVTAFEGDIVTVFVTGAADSAEAVAVTRYDGDGDITGIRMYEQHLTLGSNDATTTPLTNANIGLYDFTNTEDIFVDVNGTTLNACATTGCSPVRFFVRSGVTYTPGGRIVTHDFRNDGTFTAGAFTHELNGSWDNNSSANLTNSTIIFAATSSTESIDSTGASLATFNNIRFGTTTGNGTFTLGSTLDVDGTFTVSRGTLARASTAITVAGNLLTEANGFWTGVGTTTFDGNGATTWRDQNATLQNIGRVVVDGTSKSVTLASNVASQSIFIGANDTLDASTSNYDLTVYGRWVNQNNFVPRSGEVFFAATSSGQFITTAGDAFYDLTFSGASGGWSFTEATVNVSNDIRFTAGSVTLPTGTTTVAGSFTSTGGSFLHNNGTVYFTSTGAETITFAGGLFTNVAYNLAFSGSGGTWAMSDTNATATNAVRVSLGAVTFPSGVFAIGGYLADVGGSFTGNNGTVRMYSSGTGSITSGGSSFSNLTFSGAGSFSFADANATVLEDVRFLQGTVTLPSGTLTIGGSYDNNATVTAGSGTALFNSTDTGETIAAGASPFYNLTFNSSSGGWTITEPATSTNNTSLTAASNWTLSSGQRLSVGGTFTNAVTNAATTWTGSTLLLEGGPYTINNKANGGDAYGTLEVASGSEIKMWNSTSTVYDVSPGGYLYSQDHNGVNGELHIWGTYTRTSGTEYWSYDTDFDGVSLSGGNERQVDVKFGSSTAQFTNATLEIEGVAAASTTISSQDSDNYTLTVSDGTLSATYYEFSDLGDEGLHITDGASVTTLNNGSFIVGEAAATAITLSSTTIDANPGKQIFNVRFATTTAISADNVTQVDGAPTSYWWFRNGSGNLYGEDFDNDNGDPGSVRFDDSSLVLTIEGTVFSDAGVTPITSGTCNGSTDVVRIMVNGIEADKVPCSNIDGSFSAPGVVVVGDPTITVYLDNASGGQRGAVVTRTPTADINNLDIYANRVIVRNEDTAALTIANLAVFDADNDSDLRFRAATTSDPDTLTTLAGTELFVFDGATFAPGGNITLSGNAQANSYDGTLYVDDNATFTGAGTSTYTVGGRFVLGAGATFTSASTSVVMNATTTGKSVTAPAAISFYNLSFTGSSGGWNIGADIAVGANMTISAGTVTGTEDITLTNGSLSGNGVLSLGSGTTTLARTSSLGGTSAWTFYNLQLGNGTVVGTTTPVFTSTTTISGRLTIANAHFLDAGDTNWDLAGTGTVFVETGTFLQDTSRVRYSGNGANVLSTGYYDLDINAGAGTPTYTAVGIGTTVDNDLTIGGTAATTFNINTNDPLYDINGDVIVRSNGTLVLSGTAIFRIAGDYDNNGTVTPNSGRVTFDGAGTTAIAAGNSSFANVTVLSTGSVTVTENATTTANWLLAGASSFTVSSGQVLAVGGQFHNGVAGGVTTWTGSTLRLYGGTNYTINAATSSDAYATLDIDDTTQIRMWNSSASSYTVNSLASLYSQDHASVDGDLYIWGAYRKTSGADHWSYNTDFNGTSLGGSSRKVDVFFAPDTSVSITGGTLAVYGTGAASTTLQTQGGGDYSVLVGGNASSSFRYYEVRDIDSNGLVFTGSPTIRTLSNGDLEVSVNTGTAMTVGGSVINANPARNFNLNRFALDGVGSGFNVTATGTSVSSWRFANHFGDIDGEAFDVDPDGDPGYVAWDDSAALISISGTVYADDTTTVSSACASGEVRLMVAGISSATTSCNVGTGAYTFNNVSYGPTDSLIVYINGVSEKGAAVTKAPISNISGLNIYENHVIVRHENSDPMTIADMAVWDSTDDADIPFTAVDAGTDTLTLPADRKLVVWTGKEFEPNGNVTLTNGGSETYGGSLELFANALWTGLGTESLSVGGSMTLGSSAVFDASSGTTTFTTSGAGRTIDVNENTFNNVTFTGSGSWTISDTNTNIASNFSQTGGTLTLSTGSTTVAGSFINNGGAFTASGGQLILTGSGSRTLRAGGSNLAEVIFAGGTYAMSDTNATATESVTIESGTVSLPSGFFSVGGDFTNESGTITHNTSEIVMRNATAATLQASSSDLYAARFTGGGAYTIADNTVTFLDSLRINSGSLVLASTTTSIGGSFNALGGTFDAGSSTVLFNSSDSGETIHPGVSTFYNIQIGAPTGGYSFIASATTTNNFTLSSAASFAMQSGTVLKVEGVFTNSVGGSATNWNGSTLALDGQNAYTLNTKTSGGDRYQTLIVRNDSDIRMWNSVATTTTVTASASLYSQDHAAVNGALYIFGDFHIPVTTEYWSYATDFDGTSLGGSPREVTVAHASGATTTVDGGTLNIIGTSGNETTITNQGSGTYGMSVSDGTFNAQYYAYRNLSLSGLTFTGEPTITSLSYGDFELAVNAGSLITLASTSLNANASLLVVGNRFATTTAITGTNVSVSGSTLNAWTFTTHTGNLDGESYDNDGITLCGAIRWDDSACLLTQQTHYRWRNDDGALGVPSSEWFSASWDARKRVRVVNSDASTYTDIVAQIFVEYDSDMQADFEDLRFTESDGITVVPHWISSTTNSSRAEVWVQVPSVAANETATLFMYYNNPTATTSSSIDNTFITGDDFEDNDITEYSGQTSLFTTDTDFAYDGTYGLSNDGFTLSRANLGGIYRTDQTINQGETIRFQEYIDTSAGSGDEVCTKFAVQTPGSTNDNYAICFEQFGTDRVSLVRDVVDNESSGTVLASSTITYATGWYTVEVDWGTDDSIAVALYDESGTLAASFSDTDSTYTSGGYGFTYWFHSGGWDSINTRPTVTTEPTILFGTEQIEGGATWNVAQNTAASFDVGDVARLRVVVENTGTSITDQELQLEYAAMGVAPSCEAVNPNNYDPVQPQSSCGTESICLITTANYTNGDATVDLLLVDENTFTLGEAREDPTNTTGLIDIDQNYYTELEYAITPTVNVSDENFCFRVTDNGDAFDSYLRIARLSLQFDPTLDTPTLNDGDSISLVPGTTTRVYATSTVTDLNGAGDIEYATTTFFRSDLGAACTANNNNCYISSTENSQCTFTGCAGNSCVLECYADIFFHADPTASSSVYEGQEWLAFMEVEDAGGGYDFDTSIGQELEMLRAIDVDGAIDYGAIEVSQDTGSDNATTSVLNIGNVEVDLEVQGTDLTDGLSSVIPANEQKFSTSTFTYSACVSCELVSSTTGVALDVDLVKPTVDTPPVEDEVYWGIEVPVGISSSPHQGYNVFTPVSP